MASRILSLALVVLVAVAGYAAFRLLHASLAADVYRERLAAMSEDYGALRDRYNAAVRRTAVTELVVAEGKLSVVIRTDDGDIQVLQSPFDPSKEIYVDYVVLHGRLWIRRVFDESTAPDDGMVIDPRFVDVDWDAEAESYGKAAYRALDEGRWVVDVTGDGSLGLARRDARTAPPLSAPPPVRAYAPVDVEVDSALRSIGPSEALRALMRQLDPS